MTIQEAFECMQSRSKVKHKIRDFVGYIVGMEKDIGFERTDVLLSDWSFTEADCIDKVIPEKRYWLWDVKIVGGCIRKDPDYMDENATRTDGSSYYSKEELMKKYENEFIDVEVEEWATENKRNFLKKV